MTHVLTTKPTPLQQSKLDALVKTVRGGWDLWTKLVIGPWVKMYLWNDEVADPCYYVLITDGPGRPGCNAAALDNARDSTSSAAEYLAALFLTEATVSHVK